MERWLDIENIPFFIINHITPITHINNICKKRCEICSHHINVSDDNVVALIPKCCVRIFHFRCMITYCIKSQNLIEIDCYNCPKNGKYNFFY